MNGMIFPILRCSGANVGLEDPIPTPRVKSQIKQPENSQKHQNPSVQLEHKLAASQTAPICHGARISNSLRSDAVEKTPEWRENLAPGDEECHNPACEVHCNRDQDQVLSHPQRITRSRTSVARLKRLI